jgi:hypothetical protein
MSKLRHWKQRWCHKAPLVFLKKLKIGDGHVMPGDWVTDQHRRDLGLHRLRRWWEAGVIARADQELPRHLKEHPTVTAVGGGWYEVLLVPGQQPKKVHGKKALEEVLKG